MKIFIDGDSSPVLKYAVKIAKDFNIPVIIVKDKAHHFKDDYASIITVDINSDSADMYIFNNIEKGDILITQDMGLAALSIGKKAYVLNQNGLIINNENIDFLLENRHVSGKLRREKKVYTKIKKREPSMDSQFENSLTNLIKKIIN